MNSAYPDLFKYIPKSIPVILLANKSDLKSEIKDEGIKEIVREIGAISAVKTSAKTGSHVKEAFLIMIKRIIGITKKKDLKKIALIQN